MQSFRFKIISSISVTLVLLLTFCTIVGAEVNNQDTTQTSQDFPFKDVVTAVGIILTFIVAVANLFNSLYNNKKTLFINAVTSQRVKWISDLRENISQYMALITIYEEKHFEENGKERSEYFDKIIHLNTKIKLQLNYRDERDQEIIRLVDNIKNNLMAYYNFMKISEMEKEQAMKYLDSILGQKIDEEIINMISKEQTNLQNYDQDQFNDYLRRVREQVRIVVTNEHVQKFNTVEEALVKDTEMLIQKTQEYLKIEWNRVKEEAVKGNVK